jgi:hypothetical protein
MFLNNKKKVTHLSIVFICGGYFYLKPILFNDNKWFTQLLGIIANLLVVISGFKNNKTTVKEKKSW